ncbi:folylpolyglutamate synthase/dihydrofolate synthase family protein [Acidocella sp. KAb 2-4]|uniref:bifunctional folylpolyglutamate synthase/dihydrofolate synthase n=1 Tax=Acidocella sp. KAb 2-4 TaxID=2885158 RepID=UPI001D05D506|nr:folylpolyglutamate synthase/dihydrofolate synthase family protein [Acidocella sp. KAb 2-4]MCB5943994.1 bifunctional folylpolyglutamate synthase/dihydrofolate synthase [Acidocella sp. KAb 2-4]
MTNELAREPGASPARVRVSAALERLHTLYPKLIDLKLDRLQRLLGALGHPERHLPPVIHVAGTNGKGSVCAFARAVAEAAGLRAHVFTSPHLVRFNERIRLAGQLVTDDQLAEALDAIEAVNGPAQITVFEAITAAAFWLFARVPADIAIIEVGLGGRLDATNVVTPAACAITSISLDHQDFLGPTLEAIAGEKAGIIKPGIPVVTGFHPPEVLARITAVAAENNAPLLRRGHEWTIEPTASGVVFDGIALPPPALAGLHQVENAGIALAALRAAGFAIPPEAMAKGLQSAEWPARLQRLTGALAKRLPAGSELWLDGAHNPGGAEILAAQLTAWEGPTTLILGMKQSKDVGEVLRLLLPHAAAIFAVAEPEQHLALPVEAIIEASGGTAKPGPDLRGALAQITAPTRVLICGSLYLAGEALKLDAA